jgi:hypothetical protein
MKLYFSSELGAVIRSATGGLIRIVAGILSGKVMAKLKKFLCLFLRLQML